MQLFEQINDDNFVLYAARHYYNPRCIDVDEFYEDLNRFKYVKKLFNRYIVTGVLSERLILNHLTIILNAFGMEAGVKMIEFKLTKDFWGAVKPFLLFLKAIKPEDYVEQPLDQIVVAALRKI